MVRDLWNEGFKKDAKELWDILEENPNTQTWKPSFAEECRKIAFNLYAPFDTMKEWQEKLKKREIPYPIKTNGTWKQYPNTRNQLDKRRRVNMKKGDLGRRTSIDNAMEENTYIPQLEMGIKDAIKIFLKGKTQTFLSELVEEEEEEDE